MPSHKAYRPTPGLPGPRGPRRLAIVATIVVAVVTAGILVADNRHRIASTTGGLFESGGTDAVAADWSPAGQPARTFPEYKVAKPGSPLQREPVSRSVTRLRSKAEKQAKEKKGPAYRLEQTPVTTSFTVGTYNILGSNHTRHSRQWAPGTARAGRVAGQIVARGIDLIGMQEVQPDQLNVLNNALPGYTIWPGMALGNRSFQLQIAFRDDLFELVDTGTTNIVFSGQVRPVPYVKLRDRQTGAEFWYVDVHNSPRGLEAQRDAATNTEISLLGSLLGSDLPVMIAGDTNEPSEFFCRVGAATGMVAANGGSTSGACVLPPRPTGLDWIMGGNDTDFANYARVPVPGVSDHPIVYSDVAVTTVVTKRVPATSSRQ